MKLKFSLSLILVMFFTTFAQAEVWVTGRYDNNVDISQELTVANATSLTVTIVGATESNYDFIYIYNAQGNQVGRFHGNINETLTIEGSRITARLVSDYSITGPGVTVTAVAENNTDTTPPVITLNGTATVALIAGTPFTDPGATAQDNVDGTINVTTTGTVNTNVSGVYRLTYTATDAAGNTATAIRTIVVQPNNNTPQGQELIQGGGNGNGTIDASNWIGQGMSHNGYTGIHTYQGVNYLNNNPLADNGGMYQAINTVVGNEYVLSATLIGSNHYTDLNNYTFGGSYISIENTIPTPTSTPDYTSEHIVGNTPTTIEITFTATATTTYIALRGDTRYRYPNASMVSVQAVTNGGGADTIPPVITLNGAATMTITEGDAFTDPGATAQDNVDGAINVTTTGTVNTNTAGTYTLTYRATDATGNTATATRTVVVQSNVNPQGQELIQGGGNSNGTIDASNWIGQGMSHNGYTGIRTYQGVNYLNNNPLADNGGMYQAINTVVGNEYVLRATLIGSNHYTDLNNYTFGGSYISIENTIPTPTSTPDYTSEHIVGNTPTTIEITFTATATTTYIALRGDTRYRYPNASMVSVQAVTNGGGNTNLTLTHHWSLDGATPFVDNIGNNDGTCNGANCPTQIAGQIENAQSFNGSNTINVGSDTSLDYAANQSYAIEFWMRANSTVANQVAIGRGRGGNYLWIGTRGTKVRFQLPGGPANVSSNGDITPNQWTHVALVKNANTQQALLYINGVLDSTFASTNTAFSENVILGIGHLNGQYHFSGALDDVKFYNGILSANEISEHYTNIPTGNTDTTAPVITLTGATTITLTEGGTFTDPGATAQDNIDGVVTVTTTGTVNTNTAGTYTLTYRATDTAGNTSTRTRTIIVQATGGNTNATLIHHWSLNEQNRPYADIIGNTNGTCVPGTCPTQTGGKVATAQLFDGSKQITVASDNSLDFSANESYAISFWMSAQDSANNQVAVGRGLGGAYLWIGTRGTKVRFQLPGGPANVSSNGDITLSEWTHIVVVKDSNTQQAHLYINGTLDSTFNSNNTDFIGNFILQFGSLNGLYRFNGSLDDIQFYRGLLTQNEVLALYNSPNTGADVTPPFITIIGGANTVVTAGNVYTDLGATAQDAIDGTVPVTTTGNVNTNAAGTYTLTYTATDNSDNTATATRTVVVEVPGNTREFAFFADEYNDFTNAATGEGTGNRILQIDLTNMTLSNEIAVPGILGHHADNGFNSKMYAVPKDSNWLNVIEIRKDARGNTSMNLARQIDLIHKPRSGDAYNPDLNVILMSAKNRPMGSFINVETDQVVGTIGEDMDCRLPDGSMLLSHADANTHDGALLYQCANDDHGGDQISGHPYWLTNEYAAIVDRANRQINVYRVWQDGNTIRSQFVNSLETRTSIHQIINRDRTQLPAAQQNDYYAIEEGKPVDDQFNGGIPHALIHLRLTNNGLELVRRIDLQNTEIYDQDKSTRILETCVDIYRDENNARQGLGRTEAYQALFTRESVPAHPNQDPGAAFPVECVYAGVPGGHNGDFAPNNRHVYVGMAGGLMSVIDVNRWAIVNNLDIGRASGPGHTCFSATHDLALTTQHAGAYVRVIRGISSDRPYVAERLVLPFEREGLTSVTQSHTCHIDENEDYYYNFWTDGGVMYKMDLTAIEDNTANVATNMIVDSVYTGGMPIQGSFLKLEDIQLAN